MKIYIVACSSLDDSGIGSDCYVYSSMEEAKAQVNRLHDLCVDNYESYKEEYDEDGYADDYDKRYGDFTMVMSDLLMDHVEIIEREI